MCRSNSGFSTYKKFEGLGIKGRPPQRLWGHPEGGQCAGKFLHNRRATLADGVVAGAVVLGYAGKELQVIAGGLGRGRVGCGFGPGAHWILKSPEMCRSSSGFSTYTKFEGLGITGRVLSGLRRGRGFEGRWSAWRRFIAGTESRGNGKS